MASAREVACKYFVLESDFGDDDVMNKGSSSRYSFYSMERRKGEMMSAR